LPPDAASQARLAFDNMQRLLEAGGATLADVAKLHRLRERQLGARSDQRRMAALLPRPADRPARHILIQDLQHGMWLQLEFIALIQKAG
jgi:2-iminobutanoate/2-iminopropanoate deaminase